MMHFIFDFDGTLFNTSEGIINSAKFALSKLHINFNDSDLKSFIGPPLLDTFLNKFNMNYKEAFSAASLFRKYYTKEGILQCNPYDDIGDLLKILQNNNVYIATSKPTIYTNRILNHFNMLNLFNDVVGSNLDHTRADKKELIKFIINKHRISNLNEVYMIGDKYQDMKGAQEVGVNFIGVLYGFGTENEFTTTSNLCCSVRELRDYLLSLLTLNHS